MSIDADCTELKRLAGHGIDMCNHSWDPLGQQVVGALAETVTTALGQIITNLAANMNPVASAESGAEMFKDLI